jgi:hypothetical protein
MFGKTKETVKFKCMLSTPHHKPDEMLEDDIMKLVLQLMMMMVKLAAV